MLNFALTDDQKALVDNVRKFVKDRITPIAAECDAQAKMPLDVMKEAWELGLMAPMIPERYNGAALTEIDHVLLTEELAYGCSGIQTSITANTLCSTPILVAGTEEQKKKYLGMLTSEFALGAYAITEPAAGSDAAGIQMTCAQHGDDWVLSGTKCFITNASYARWYIVFATTDPDKRHKGIMCFIVDRDAEGVSVGKKEDKMGQRASDTSTVILEEVKVPKGNVLAGEGEGFRLAMQTFDRTRPDIGASACGLMRRALDESVAYATERKTFGTAIANHQMVQLSTLR